MAAAVLLLQGCSAVPGMYMQTEGETSGLEVPVTVDGETVLSKVTITPITANLIIDQEAPRFLPGRTPPPGEQYHDYRIGPRDILSITVWDHPELTIPAGSFRDAESSGHLVKEDGTLFYPYVGRLKVAGMTMEKLRRVLASRLSTFIENPQLDVRVIAYRSQRAYVVGEVAEPGIQPIDDVPLTVTEAINRAGGITERADLRNVTLSRNGEVYDINLLAIYEDGDLSQNVLLKHGDVLSVADANRSQNKVFVLGEVVQPSSQVINKGRMTLTEALSDAGGVDPVSSNPGRIYVIRSALEKPEIFHLNARSPDALLLADRFELAPRDVIYVDTAEVTRWNRVISQILPTAQTLNQTSATDFPLFQGGGN